MVKSSEHGAELAARLILSGPLLTRFTIGSFADINRLDQQVTVQEAENAELEERNAALVREVDELQTGMDAIEEHARNELGLIREGETFFLLIEEESPAENADISPVVSYPEYPEYPE